MTRVSLKDNPMIVGAMVLSIFLVSLVVAFKAESGLPWQDGTVVTADFAEVGALRPGDEVRMASLRIGTVQTIEYVDGLARVVMELDSDRELHQDVRAEVWSRSALGKKFVELVPGTEAAGSLGENGKIPLSRTSPPAELDNLFNALDRRTREQLASTLREAGGGMAGHSQDLHDLIGTAPDLLDDLGVVSRAVARDEADLVAMMQQARNLSSRFAGRQQEITDLMEQMRSTLDAVGVSDGEPLAATLQAAPETLVQVREGLNALNGPLQRTETAMRTLRPGAQALGEATPDLRVAMRQAVSPLDKVPGVAELAGPSVEDLTAVVADAVPLAPKLTEAVRSSLPVLDTLAPYSPESTLR